MALTKAKVREILSKAGVNSDNMAEAVDAIIDGNVTSIEALREDVAKYKAEAERLSGIEKEFNAMKANNDGSYKEKYEKEHKAFEEYKNDVTAKENKTAKENAVKAYFEGKNISGKNLEIAMRGCTAEIAALELEDGKIKDTATLDELVNGTYAGLVQTTHTTGTSTSNPPANGGGKSTKTMAEIMAIKDTAERQRAIAENPEVFGLDFSD